jgi:hypothetical protein
MTTTTFDYEPATWRLLDSGVDGGATNMAIDEAIVQAVAAGGAGDVAFLRLGTGLPEPGLRSRRPRSTTRAWLSTAGTWYAARRAGARSCT